MSGNKVFCTYIVTNKRNNVLYTGFSGDMEGRVWKHKVKFFPKSFSARYNVNKLVYIEYFENPLDAIAYEKRLKNWKREWKIELIKKNNPEFNDLSKEWFNDDGSRKE